MPYQGLSMRRGHQFSKPGVYRGQCTELCGKDHGFMPVVVVAMEQADYDVWKKK